MKTVLRLFIVLLASRLLSAEAAFLYVGPGMSYSKPSQAAVVAQDGDTIEIEVGVYAANAAVWTQNDLTIRSVGGRAHLKSEGATAHGKATWVIQGNNTVVEGIEFSGASVEDRNGAGIRLEGTNLTVRDCHFHNNENGILTGSNSESEVLIERSVFHDNGYGDGYSHNLYVGAIKRLTLRHNSFHHAKVGHQAKSRAAENYILYNQFMDQADGNASYQIDLPNGGLGIIMGNLLQQSVNAENSTLLSYAAEGSAYPVQQLEVINNTFVNDRGDGYFVRVGDDQASVRIVNNIFAGRGEVLSGRGELTTNLVSDRPGFRNRRQFDYRLKPGSPAVDAGSAVGPAGGVDLSPNTHYVHEAQHEPRVIRGPVDIGAYELVD